MNGTLTTLSILALGLGLGLKHAIEADHLAAVTTIVSERKSVWGAALVGAFWGVGHTISLFVAGLLVLLLRVEIAERTAQALELGVAIMLVGLGTNVLVRLARGERLHTHVHKHGGVSHEHPHMHTHARAAHTHESRPFHHHLRGTRRPLLVGMAHGLAGSAALMLLVLSTVSSPALGLAYIGVFGIGSIAGMTAVSALVSLPMRLTAVRFASAERAMQCAAGLVGVGFGLYLAYRILIVDGLLRF